MLSLQAHRIYCQALEQPRFGLRKFILHFILLQVGIN